MSFGQISTNNSEVCFRELFDMVIADPPFLSEECATKTSVTVKYLAKKDAQLLYCTGNLIILWLSIRPYKNQLFYICLACLTVLIYYFIGATMEDLLGRLLSLRCCKYIPRHKNNLANEFRCFANYNLDDFMANKCSN